MLLELERNEQQLLVRLVNARIRRLTEQTEAARGDVERERCEEERHVAERLLRHLHEAEWDVTC